MGKIVLLDENTSNKIAAGEVVERPASVVKELVENSIDANASNISIEIKNGGISYIKITDNGSGIEQDDAVIAFERHATSKIRSADDLEAISSLGFRGEALASIASVSKIELSTKAIHNPHGFFVKIEGGKVLEARQTGCPNGTTFIIRDLFYNVPARFKFLKKDYTEAGYVAEIVERCALGNPNISFKLTSQGSKLLYTPGNGDLQSVVYSVYGKEIASNLCEVKYNDNGIVISGYVGKPEIAKSNRTYQSIFLNKRYIKSKLIGAAIEEAYKTLLMKNKFPFAILNIQINPLLFDVNVHPTKMEVRFSNEQDIFRSVYFAVNSAVMGRNIIKNAGIIHEVPNKTSSIKSGLAPIQLFHNQNINNNKDIFKIENKDIEKKVFVQEKIQDKAQEKVQDKIQDKIDVEKVLPVQNITSKIQEEKPKYEIEKPKPVREDIESAPTKNIFENAKIIGQAFSTYIILEQNDKLLLIDQHAAHERVMFEKIKHKFSNNSIPSQMLLSPMAIDLTGRELKFLKEHKDFLNKLGFFYDEFGNNSILLRSVPYLDAFSDDKNAFMEVVDKIIEKPDFNNISVLDEILYVIACKTAVKANKKLGEIEIRALMNEMEYLENPYTCPHGRPTLINMTKNDFEKMFKRIV